VALVPILAGAAVVLWLALDDEPVPEAPQADLNLTLEPLLDGLSAPVGLEAHGDRLFVMEQAGAVRRVEDRRLDPEPFLDIRDRVRTGSEQGLLGLAFPRDHGETGRFYVHYSDEDGDTVLARFRTLGSDPARGDADSEEVLLRVEQPHGNHNGGQIAFGPDGMLYLGLGDGGSAGDPHGNGQDPSTLLGAILRLDVSVEEGYAVPGDNPFIGRDDARPEVWAYGLRNPWRFSFDPATGDLWIGDVGQSAIEEVDLLPAGTGAGANLGWDLYEGTQRFEGGDPRGPTKELTFPVAEYSRTGGHCAVTGGHVIRDDGDLDGTYLFGDYCSGQLWTVRPDGEGGWTTRRVLDTDLRISSFGQDAAGRVYVVDHGGGVWRIGAS